MGIYVCICCILHIHMYIHMYIPMYIHMYLYIYRYMYMYTTYVHTNTHTHIQRFYNLALQYLYLTMDHDGNHLLGCSCHRLIAENWRSIVIGVNPNLWLLESHS